MIRVPGYAGEIIGSEHWSGGWDNNIIYLYFQTHGSWIMIHS